MEQKRVRNGMSIRIQSLLLINSIDIISQHAMLAVLGIVSLIQDATYGKILEIACINGPTETVVFGPVVDIDRPA